MTTCSKCGGYLLEPGDAVDIGGYIHGALKRAAKFYAESVALAAAKPDFSKPDFCDCPPGQCTCGPNGGPCTQCATAKPEVCSSCGGEWKSDGRSLIYCGSCGKKLSAAKPALLPKSVEIRPGPGDMPKTLAAAKPAETKEEPDA
jgi:hypothetical protein